MRDSGMEYTILRPDYFMQNLCGYAPAIRARGGFECISAQAPLCMIDCRDIADAAVATITDDGHAGKSYDLTGPQALSIRQAADKLGACLGRSIDCIETSPEHVRAKMSAIGMPEWLIREMTSGSGLGEGLSPTTAVADITMRAPRSFGQFAHEYASVLLKET